MGNSIGAYSSCCILLLLITVLTPPAAATDTMFHANPERTGVFNNGEIVPTNNELWRFKTGGAVVSSPAVLNGVVYIGSDKNLYAIDAVTVKEQWRFPTGNIISSSPAVSNGVVYFGSTDGYIYAIDAVTVKEQWRFPTGKSISSSPAVSNGVVYIGSDDNKLYAIDAVSGKKNWEFPTGNSISSSPAVSNGVVYVGSRDNYLYAFDAVTGKEKWRFATEGWVDSSPAVSNGVVYVGSDDKNLYAIDAVSGKKNWEFPTGNSISSSPAVSNGVIYVGSKDNNLYAIDAVTGKEKWRFTTGSYVSSSPAVSNGIIYVGSYDKHLYAIDAVTGTEKWRFKTGGFVHSSPAVSNGIVYVGSNDNNVNAIGGVSTSAQTPISQTQVSITKPQGSDSSNPLGIIIFLLIIGIVVVTGAYYLMHSLKTDPSPTIDPWVCKKCNNKNKTGSTYCLNCGTKKENHQEKEDDVCPNCGKIILDKQYDFCTLCGSQISSKTSPKPNTTIKSDVKLTITEERNPFEPEGEEQHIEAFKKHLEQSFVLDEYDEANDSVAPISDETKPLPLPTAEMQSSPSEQATTSPNLLLTTDKTQFVLDKWYRLPVHITNTGTAHAVDISFTFSEEFETKWIKPVTIIESGSSIDVIFGLRPKHDGNIPMEIRVQYKDVQNKEYKQTFEYWIDVAESLLNPIVQSPSAFTPKSLTQKQLPTDLSDRYTDSEFIGKGGFARVFKAKRKDGLFVAVKIPISLDESTGKSFIAELQNWTRLDHPNIVKVYNFNIMPSPYFEMELCDNSLAEREKPIESEEAAWILFNVCEGLKFTHAQKIIHRDLKPHNILIKNGVPKISDWGLSRVITESTSTTAASFTPYYAAPEQISSNHKDERTDIWQLGVIFYELVTGQLPFTGDSIVTVMAVIASKNPTQPSLITPSSHDVEAMIMKCLKKNPDRRYQSVLELQKDLALYLRITYTESLKMSLTANDLRRSASYCGDLVMINLLTGDIPTAYKYLLDLIHYSKGDVKVEAQELSEQIKMRMEMGVTEIPDELLQKAEIIVHQLSVGFRNRG